MVESFLRTVLAELYGQRYTFRLLLEAMLNEAWIPIADWETNERWTYDEHGKQVGRRELSLEANDFVNTVIPGSSISNSKYVFLPMSFALERSDAANVLAHIASIINRDGSVKLTVLPGYGIESEEAQGAYPARTYPSFNAEMKALTQDQLGNGWVVVGVNGEPVSRLLTKPLPLGTSGNEPIGSNQRLGGWLSGPVPKWLEELVVEVDAAERAGKVQLEKATKLPGFEGDLIVSSRHGDAVMVISRSMARAAYIFKKKCSMNGAPTDFDICVSTKMKELISKYKRKPAGTKKEDIPRANLEPKRQPKLMLRDWLLETGNGYALRRDYRREDIKRLLDNGVNFEDGKRLADTHTKSSNQDQSDQSDSESE